MISRFVPCPAILPLAFISWLEILLLAGVGIIFTTVVVVIPGTLIVTLIVTIVIMMF